MEEENGTREEITDVLSAYDADEQAILSLIIRKEKAHIDDIILICGLGASKTASILLKLEFEGTIAGLPGKLYEFRK